VSHRLRGALVAVEIALALLLLVGSGLLLRSFSRLQEVPPGFQPDHLFVADIPLSLTAYAKPEDRYQFFDRLVERGHGKRRTLVWLCSRDDVLCRDGRDGLHDG